MQYTRGPLTIETTREGDWMYILDSSDGTVLCEIDCGLSLENVPPHLHADLAAAYKWAVAANKKDVKQQSLFKDEEISEWRQYYESTRGIH